ncbi:MAG: cell division protein FtsA [Sediminibacterium sp.]|nr:cell division protein FtsA [Sediminibacterium sp.]
MAINNNNIIVGLDIGTTKVCAIVGQMAENGKINVLGMGKAPSLGGVARGMVANVNKAVVAIQAAVEDAIRQSQVDIKTVFVGIAGHHIKSLQHRGTLSRKQWDTEITEDELNKLESEMENLALSPGVEILHVLPQEYRIDGEDGIKDPIGRVGVRVECNYHIITGETHAAKTIIMAVRKAGLEIADLVVEPVASAAAVLSEPEMEAGVALVDIGGCTTDICIFDDGAIRHTAIIPIGGDRITKDLQEAFSILKDQGEFVKVNDGAC